MVLAHDITKGDRTKDVQISQNVTFENMLLDTRTLKGLKDSGFLKPSPVQLYGIPIGKCGFDLLLEAKSGTGKTAVFSIIALEKLDFCKSLQVVILTPTREIAAQICDVLKQIGSTYDDLKVEVVMGGLPLKDDIEKFKKPVHIVVGSPGRLKHLIQEKHINLDTVRLLVFDEADKLMEKSFQTDINFIHTALPKQKQVIMSSATYPDSSKHLINSYVQNASHVCPDSNGILLGINQKVTFVKCNNNIVKQTQDRFTELHKILVQIKFKQCLIFCNYQARVTEVHKLLKKQNWPSQQLHGQQGQVDRLDALKTLQQYKCRILVSTDLAARGIDASNIDLVVNFEPPYDWQTYLHRIGRAGRFGSYGLAITILNEGAEQQKFRELLISMELSDNISYLWSDKIFNTKTSSQTSLQDLCNSVSDNSALDNLLKPVNIDIMWELLNNRSDEIHAIESFETLCQSKEHTEIKPFSELMHSLKVRSCHDSKEIIFFKHMEMSKVPDLRLTSNTQYTVPQNNNKNYDGVTEIFVDDGNVNESIEELKEVLRDTVETTTSNKEIEKVYLNAHHDINENLLYSELPKTFSSSKFKVNHIKRSHQKPTLVKETKSTNSSNQVKINKKKLEAGQTRLPTFVNPIEISHDSENSCNLYTNINKHKKGNTKSDDCFNGKNTCFTNYNYFTNSIKLNYVSSQPRKHLRTHKDHIERTRSYTDWCNQLKMKMKYIQQAIYVDEISRLQ